MSIFLWEKIEAIRREPEHVRMRYVVMCVSVSMVFIVGIWLFSVQDSISAATKDLPQVLEKGEALTGGTPSLNDLFERSAPLRVEEQNQNGSEFFDQQLNGQSTTESEGMTPSQVKP